MANKKRQCSQEEAAIIEKKRRLETRLRYLQAHLRHIEYGENRGIRTPVGGGGISSRTPTSTTRSGRVAQRPPKYDEKPQPVKLSGALSKCRKLVDALLNQKGSWIFADPVDPVKWNISNYFNIIKKPMDLGTVKKNLSSGMYLDVDAFGADMRLIWANAIKYNGVGTDIAKVANQMSDFFEDRFKKIQKVSFRVGRDGKLMKHSSFSRKSKKKKSKKAPVNLSDQNLELIKLKREMESMRKTISNFSSKKGVSGKVMTESEKRTLSEDIMNLPHSELELIVDIVSRCMPNLRDDDNDEGYEIDLDALDNDTLRELQQHVRRNKRSSKKSTSRTKTPTRPSLDPPNISRHHSAPARSSYNDSSSSESSSASDSESSSDSEVGGGGGRGGGKKGMKQPRSRASVKKQQPSYGDPSLFSATDIAPEPSPTEMSRQNSQDSEDVKVNSDAWNNLGADTEQERRTSSNGDGKNRLWAEFQRKKQQQKEQEEEKKKLELEAAKKREEELERRKEEEEMARKLAEERAKEEIERKKMEAKEVERQKQKDLEARREEARRKREQSARRGKVDDLDSGVDLF